MKLSDSDLRLQRLKAGARVNAREEEELRSASPEVKWRQFQTLLGWARQFGWAAALGKGVIHRDLKWENIFVTKRWGG